MSDSPEIKKASEDRPSARSPRGPWGFGSWTEGTSKRRWRLAGAQLGRGASCATKVAQESSQAAEMIGARKLVREGDSRDLHAVFITRMGRAHRHQFLGGGRVHG